MIESQCVPPTLSIILCTRNRSALLRSALDSLVAQDPTGGEWEIIVVDNGSTDDTPEVIRAFASRGVRYTFEAVPGLGRARNCGIAIATGAVLAFTDDDVVAHRDWARRICARFTEDPAIAAVFGYTYCDPGVDSMFSMCTRRDPCYLEGKERVWDLAPGNNMACRRAAMERTGLFDASLGAGSKYHTADDAEFSYRLLKAGLKAFYDPEIKVWHRPDVDARPPEAEILRSDAGIAAWYGKHTAHGDLFAARLFLVHLRRSVMGIRSLSRAVGRTDGPELRFRGRRARVLLSAFFSRALMELRQ